MQLLMPSISSRWRRRWPCVSTRIRIGRPGCSRTVSQHRRAPAPARARRRSARGSVVPTTATAVAVERAPSPRQEIACRRRCAWSGANSAVASGLQSIMRLPSHGIDAVRDKRVRFQSGHALPASVTPIVAPQVDAASRIVRRTAAIAVAASNACSASSAASVNATGRAARVDRASAAARNAPTVVVDQRVAIAQQPAVLAAGDAPHQCAVARIEFLHAVRRLDHLGPGHRQPAFLRHHDRSRAARDDAHAAEAAAGSADQERSPGMPAARTSSTARMTSETAISPALASCSRTPPESTSSSTAAGRSTQRARAAGRPDLGAMHLADARRP